MEGFKSLVRTEEQSQMSAQEAPEAAANSWASARQRDLAAQAQLNVLNRIAGTLMTLQGDRVADYGCNARHRGADLQPAAVAATRRSRARLVQPGISPTVLSA
jgi:hypothetical protein